MCVCVVVVVVVILAVVVEKTRRPNVFLGNLEIPLNGMRDFRVRTHAKSFVHIFIVVVLISHAGL